MSIVGNVVKRANSARQVGFARSPVSELMQAGEFVICSFQTVLPEFLSFHQFCGGECHSLDYLNLVISLPYSVILLI